MSPFSCQAKRGIKYFPFRGARQQPANVRAKSEQEGKGGRGRQANKPVALRTENRKTVASNREPPAFPFYVSALFLGFVSSSALVNLSSLLLSVGHGSWRRVSDT